MARTKLVLSTARNVHTYCLNNTVITLVSIVLISWILLTVILLLLLLFSFYRHLGLTFTRSRVSTDNYESCFSLSESGILGIKYCRIQFNISIRPPDLFYHLPDASLSLSHIPTFLTLINYSIQVISFRPILLVYSQNCICCVAFYPIKLQYENFLTKLLVLHTLQVI